MSFVESDKCKLEDEFQSIYSLIEKYTEIKNSNIQHLKRLKDFEAERIKLFDKIKSLEDVLKESQISLEKFSNSDMSFDCVNSSSRAVSDSKIMFVKSSMPNNHAHEKSREKDESKFSQSRFIPTCHHYGIIGHTPPKCFQIRSQKSGNKHLVPKKDEPGFENQVKALSEQVKN
jgi:hypothetical protein